MNTPNKILSTEFSEQFVKYMKNRMVMGVYKYGKISDEKKDVRVHRNEINNAKHRIKAYEETGNTEFLVDAANYLMIEFMEMSGCFIATDGTEYSKVIYE